MPMKTMAISGVILVAAGLVYLTGFHRPRYESGHPLALLEARKHIAVELPANAEGIWILTRSSGPGHFVQFAEFSVIALDSVSAATAAQFLR